MAHDGDDAEMSRAGAVSCNATNFTRQGGSEIHLTNLNVRNVSVATPIRIDRIVVYDATATVLFDSNDDGFPQFETAFPTTADRLLGPKQTGQLGTDSFLPFVNDNLRRPFQMEVSWSAGERVHKPHFSTSRVVRQRNPAEGAQLDERSRDGSECRHMILRR